MQGQDHTPGLNTDGTPIQKGQQFEDEVNI